MSGKHCWRKNKKYVKPKHILNFKATMPSHYNKETRVLEFIGPIPEANVKAGLPATLFGIPLVVDDADNL